MLTLAGNVLLCTLLPLQYVAHGQLQDCRLAMRTSVLSSSQSRILSWQVRPIFAVAWVDRQNLSSMPVLPSLWEDVSSQAGSGR